MTPSPLPYEASVAAATFYALGAVRERWGDPAPSGAGVGVSGFQNTSFDPLLGDTELTVEGRHLLIEFKRSNSGVGTEWDKARRAEFLTRLAAWPKDEHDATDAAHALIFGQAHPGPRIAVSPYRSLTQSPTVHAACELTDFCVGLLRDHLPHLDPALAVVASAQTASWGVAHGVFERYLDKLLGDLADPGNGGRALSSDASSVGYLVSLSPNGMLSARPYTSLAQLAALRWNAMQRATFRAARKTRAHTAPPTFPGASSPPTPTSPPPPPPRQRGQPKR